MTVLPTEYVNPETGKFCSAGTCKSTGVQFILVLPRTENHEKYVLTEYSIRDSPCMHEMRARESICMHTCMSWPAVSKELLAAKYARVAPRCRTAWPLCWPQTAFCQQRSSCLLCKTESTPLVPRLKQALLSRF